MRHFGKQRREPSTDSDSTQPFSKKYLFQRVLAISDGSTGLNFFSMRYRGSERGDIWFLIELVVLLTVRLSRRGQRYHVMTELAPLSKLITNQIELGTRTTARAKNVNLGHASFLTQVCCVPECRDAA